MISETRSIYFRHILNSDGTIAAESFFRIKSDAATVEEARAEAAAWAGNIGTPLIVGGGGYNLRQGHPDFVLDALEIKQLDHEFIFELCMTGRMRYDGWQLLAGGQRIEEAGKIIEHKEYLFCGAETPSYPHAGEVSVAGDGSRMVCTKSQIIDMGGNRKKLCVTFSSAIGGVTSDENGTPAYKVSDFFRDNSHWRKVTLYWDRESYGSKIAELRFHDEAYTSDWLPDGYVPEKMESTPDGEYGHFVEITARKLVTELVSLESREDGGVEKKIAVYHVRKSDIDQFSGLVGTVPVFASDDFIITNVVQKNITPALFEVTVSASVRSLELQLGEIALLRSEEGVNLKKASFFVSSEEAPSFREKLEIGSPAEWAGDNYYLEVFSEKESAYGSTFELQAKEIYNRMLSLSEEEKFSGFAIDGTPCRKVSYTSVWQVRPDELTAFANLAGTNADWSNDDAIITEVVPRQHSALEYRVTVKAERRSNPELHMLYNCENYESLSGRVDLDCELVDFRFSPKECGYFINCDGIYELIPGWLPASECPILTAEALHPRYINAIIKVLRVSESTYKKGSMCRIMDELVEWNNTRVFNGKVGNYSGSYLKCGLHAKEIYDNHGVQWTKITKIYDLAPNGASWSLYYFRQIGN